jgi:hypothetical protein
LTKTVGIYEIGWERCEILLKDGRDGSFSCVPSSGGFPVISLGADQPWGDLVDVFLHEAIELTAVRVRSRFEPSCEVNKDHGQYIFVMTHSQLSECCARTAELLVKALPDIASAWRLWKKRGKKK